MARNGSGTFERVHDWTDDAAANIDITASRFDAETDGIATALTESIARDGQTVITANLPMATYRHTGVGNAAARTDYTAAGQTQDSGMVYAVDAGAADAYVVTLTPAITAYAAGQTFRIKLTNANTGASTININAVGAKAITDTAAAALTGGEILANQIYCLFYDGTQFQLLNPAPATVGRGKQTIYIPAAAMTSTITNGAAASTIELATNDVMLATFNFDKDTDEKVQFGFLMPKSWNEGTITAKFIWSHATATAFGVAWGIQGMSFADGDGLDQAFGTAVVTTDTGATADDVYVSGEAGAVTIGGTPGEEDYVIMQVYRDVSDAGDTLDVDARLIGVRMLYTTDANTDD